MATRSFIARYNSDTDTYTAIYCHWDGYPTGVGLTLRDHYNDDQKVRMLVDMGGLSSLGDTLMENRSLDDEPSILFKSIQVMEEHYRHMWCEYGYIWRNNRWDCFELNPREIDLYADHLTNENINV